MRFRPSALWVAPFALLFLAQGIYVSILRYVHFRSTLDLSFFVSVLHWHTRGEGPLHTPILGDSFLSHHMSPGLLLLQGPFYLSGSYPPSLVWMQGAAVAASAFLLYHIAREQAGDPRAGLLAAVLFLFGRAVIGAAFITDFHPVVFLPLPLFAAVLGFYRNSWPWTLAGLGGALLVQEDVPLTIAAAAFFFHPPRCSRRMRLTLVAAGLAGTLLMVGAQKTFFANDHTLHMSRYGWLSGQDAPPAPPQQLIRRGIEAHGDVLTMLGWAPALSPAAWGASIPAVLQNALSTSPFARKLLAHYGLSFATILCLGIGVSWVRVGRWRKRLASWLEGRRLDGEQITRWMAYALVAIVLHTAYEDHRMGSTVPTMRRFHRAWQYPDDARAPAACVDEVKGVARSHPAGRWGIQSRLLPHLAQLDAVELAGGRHLEGIQYAAYDTRTLGWGDTEDPNSDRYDVDLVAERLEAAGFAAVHSMDGCSIWTIDDGVRVRSR